MKPIATGGEVPQTSKPQSPDLHDRAEFEAVYIAERGSAVRLAWLLTRDSSTAEDVVHDAFAELYEAFERVRLPVAYLRRSIVNGVARRARSREREHRRHSLVMAGQPISTPDLTPTMIDVIAKLPIDQRTAIVLRYWAGLRDREIAEAMSLPPGTVRSHLSRATARLRKDLM